MFYVRDDTDLLPVPTFGTIEEARSYAVERGLYVAVGNPLLCSNCGNEATTRPGICDDCLSICFGESDQEPPSWETPRCACGEATCFGACGCGDTEPEEG